MLDLLFWLLEMAGWCIVVAVCVGAVLALLDQAEKGGRDD